MNSIQEKIQDIKAHGLYHISSADIYPDSQRADTSFKGRITPALLSGIGAFAGSAVLPKLLLKINPPPAMVAAITMAGLGSGYFAPDFYNAALDAKRGKISKSEAIDIIKRMEGRSSMVGEKANEVAGHYNDLTKNATITGTLLRAAGKGIKYVAKGIGGGAKLWAHGIAPVDKTAPIGAKVFGLATKGVTLGGIGYGAYSAHKAFTAPRSGSNYSTMLRNNVLAGNVQANELSPIDRSQVQKLGLR
jgi:hypothetical protein